MASNGVAKVTISLPKGLLGVVDQLASERSITRSALIAELIAKEEDRRIQQLMEEGYKEMAAENQRLAEEAFPLVAEAMLWVPWDEANNG